MNSVQESKNELEAAIRYAENAISSAKQTIESMEFRQEMAKKQYSEQTGREAALQEERDMLEKNVKYLRDENERLKREKEASSVQHGVEAACTELEGQTIMVEESEYVSNFEVSFTKEIDLDDELDLDWMRGKLGRYDEGFVTDALSNLCADKEFECRIHGVDDQEEKKND